MGLIGKSTTLKAILNMVCQKVGASMAEDEAHKAHIQYTFNILIWQTRINGISEYTEATMKIAEVKDRKPDFINQLLEVWENSVRATHLFLSDSEIKNIKEYVPKALNGIAHLIIAEDEAGCPVAFMGIEGDTLEMLFIAPEERGKGLGKRLIQYGIENYSIEKLTVNEQNPQAKGFYEHMGFRVYKRTDLDEQGNPYPILYMSR